MIIANERSEGDISWMSVGSSAATTEYISWSNVVAWDEKVLVVVAFKDSIWMIVLKVRCDRNGSVIIAVFHNELEQSVQL